MSRASLHRPVTVIVPCGGAKRAGTHKARELYTSSTFRSQLAAAEAIVESEGGRVLILSALHGLVELDQLVEEYDVKMGDARSITPIDLAIQMVELGLQGSDDELSPAVYSMLPKAYFECLHAASALLYVYPQDVYEAAPGIGYQRGVASIVKRTHGPSDETAGATA